ASLDDDTTTAQARRVRRDGEEKWMKSKGNNPVAGKGADVFTLATQRHISFVIDKYFHLRRRDVTPVRVRPLWRNEHGLAREGIENPDCGVRGKISREKPEMTNRFIVDHRCQCP